MLHRQEEGNSVLDKMSVEFICFTLTIFILLEYLPPFRTVSRIWIYLLDQAGWPRTLEKRENGEKNSLQGKIRECEILLKIREKSEFKKILSL